MDLQTLRDQVRDLVSEDSTNLPDSTLDDLIERATQRIETDFTDDYGVTPRQMVAKTSGTITEDGFLLPSDWLRARSVSIGDSILRYVPPEKIPQTSQGVDSTVNLVYYQKLDKLVNDTDTNWLLDTASRVYVYGTAIEYARWNKDANDEVVYAGYYKDAIDKTSRANSPRPSGGFGRAKGRQLGEYTIIGDYMVFGYSY